MRLCTFNSLFFIGRHTVRKFESFSDMAIMSEGRMLEKNQAFLSL